MDEYRTGTHLKVLNPHLPVESFGRCRNAHRCKNTDVDLGNGFCMKCYDKGLDRFKSPRASKDRDGRLQRVLKFKKQKLTSREISDRLGISQGTVFEDIGILRGRGEDI